MASRRRGPSMNANRDQLLASLQRIATVLEDKKATLWINHDKRDGRLTSRARGGIVGRFRRDLGVDRF